MSSTQLVWLITGTSTGLGAALIPSLLARNQLVIATARKSTSIPIPSPPHPNLSTLPLNLTSPFSNIAATIAQAKEVHGRIDVLVNNAGYVQAGNVEDLEEEDWEKQFQTNVFGTVKVTKAVLPSMRERGSGWIVIIGSLSGWIGHAGTGAYASSKFALEGIAESLHAETSPLGIHTLLIEPGRFRTPLLSPSNLHARATATAAYKAQSDGHLADLAASNLKQPGDPEKLTEILADIVCGEGVAKDKHTPFRLQLGRDCWEDVRAKCEETIRSAEEWRDVSLSTDHAE